MWLTITCLFTVITDVVKCLVVSVMQETWWALLLLSMLPVVRPFYVPGVAPRNFREGETVDIKVRLKINTAMTCFYLVTTVASHYEGPRFEPNCGHFL